MPSMYISLTLTGEYCVTWYKTQSECLINTCVRKPTFLPPLPKFDSILSLPAVICCKYRIPSLMLVSENRRKN